MHPNEKSKNYIYFQYLCIAYTALVTTVDSIVLVRN